MDIELADSVETETDFYTSVVRHVMRVEDITTGNPQKDYLVRYRGEILGDPAQAYTWLSGQLKPAGVTPLFRIDQGRHAVILLPGVNQAKTNNPVWNIVMFVLTMLSVIAAGALMSNVYENPQNLAQTILGGLPFALSMMGILLAHEFGHYLVGRYNNVHVTLPYFIPFPPPISPFGTLGAFIQMKEIPRNKRVLMDIGIAGPLAGLAVAIPLLFLGLYLSKLDVIDTYGMQPGMYFTLEGNSLLYLMAKYVVFGRLLPEPVTYGALPPLIYWVRYFFTGQPVPLGGVDVMIHPVAWAGWAGLLVTSLNLIPAGQLDGGHLVYVLIGRRARLLWPFILACLVLLGFVWTGWWLWAGLIFFFGRMYAEPLDTITQIDGKRKALAAFGILLFFLVFIPVPLISIFAR